jgi:hypothetical protein
MTLYRFSKIYCLSSFNLKLYYENANLHVIGGKIPYDFLISSFGLLKENIKLLKENKQLQSGSIEFKILQSLEERSLILLEIIEKLNDIVFHSTISDFSQSMMRMPSSKSIDDLLKHYIDQIEILEAKITEIRKVYPLQERSKEKEDELLKAQNRLDQSIINLKKTAMNFKQNLSEENSELFVKNTNIHYNAFKTTVTGVLNITSDAFENIGHGFKNALLVTILGIVSTVVEITQSLFMYLLSSPMGIIILLVLTSATYYFCGPVIGIVYKLTKNVYVVISGMSIYIYRITTTTLGLLVQPLARWKQNPTELPGLDRLAARHKRQQEQTILDKKPGLRRLTFRNQKTKMEETSELRRSSRNKGPQSPFGVNKKYKRRFKLPRV